MLNSHMVSRRDRRIAALMGLQALSMAVESVLHLSGAVHDSGGTEVSAGVAEAIICVVLVCGASSLASRGTAARRIPLGTIIFAIAGFCLGLTFTIPSGYAPDIAYHAIVLPILLVTFALVLRGGLPGGNDLSGMPR